MNDKIILSLVAEFGSQSATGLNDGWADLLVGVAKLVGADGYLVRPGSNRLSTVSPQLVSWGTSIPEWRVNHLLENIGLTMPGAAANVRGSKYGPALILVEDRRIIVFHRRIGAAGFSHARGAIASAVVSACSALRPRAPGLPARLESIPARVGQTLRGLLAGLSEKEIAYSLGLSRNTVHAYVKSLYRTARVNSRFELISLCVRSGTQVESILRAEFTAAFKDEHGKVPNGQVHPGQEIVPPANPVPPVDRKVHDVHFGDPEPSTEFLNTGHRFQNFRPRRKIHNGRIVPRRKKRYSSSP